MASVLIHHFEQFCNVANADSSSTLIAPCENVIMELLESVIMHAQKKRDVLRWCSDEVGRRLGAVVVARRTGGDKGDGGGVTTVLSGRRRLWVVARTGRRHGGRDGRRHGGVVVAFIFVCVGCGWLL
ncbi:hypothetical protein PIB30_000045 [Stylosanthes scabra]|uniref:Uncharacterized protein n=1 Tax=Stylosanthes scabra TaxID=79078 RepID=A0ABU6Q333_9FABA|nr:hypothetical protein [Stylosanthes scabra]